MPKFFFDTRVDQQGIKDGSGVEPCGREEARRQALTALRDVAHDELPDGDMREFVVEVRDEAGQLIYEASVRLEGRWVTSA